MYAAFLVVMAPIGRLAACVFALDGPDSRALVFSGATRNSLVVRPLALPDEFALAAVVVVTQTRSSSSSAWSSTCTSCLGWSLNQPPRLGENKRRPARARPSQREGNRLVR